MPELKVAPLPITDPEKVPFTFISDIASSGYQNGVINMTLVTAYFTPTATDDGSIKPDLRISARLRMDMYCAQRLWTVLDEALRMQKTPQAGAN